MEVFGLEHLMECIVMMERPSRTLKIKRVRNKVIANHFNMELCFRRYIFRHRQVADIFNRWIFYLSF